MKLKIIPDDNVFMVDGVTKKGFTFTVDSEIHAVTWDDTYGEIEYKTSLVDGVLQKKPNLLIYDTKKFNSLIKSWNSFKEIVEETLPFGYKREIYDLITQISYKYIINEVRVAKEYAGKEKIVDTVGFYLEGILNGKKHKELYSCKLSKYQDEGEFVQFDDLTEQDMINWLNAELPEEEVIKMKYVVAESLSKSYYDEIVVEVLPWVKIEREQNEIVYDLQQIELTELDLTSNSNVEFIVEPIAEPSSNLETFFTNTEV